jgi:hypothetical protein
VSRWFQPSNLFAHIGDVLFVLRVAALAAVVPLLMRLPLDRLRTVLEPRRVPLSVDPARQQHVLDLVNLVVERGRRVLRTTCLTRGVARYYFLRRAGMNVALAFGVGHPAQMDAAGHCWLVKDGQPFLEREDPRPMFIEVFRIAAA